jgi:hypothetical protein
MAVLSVTSQPAPQVTSAIRRSHSVFIPGLELAGEAGEPLFGAAHRIVLAGQRIAFQHHVFRFWSGISVMIET